MANIQECVYQHHQPQMLSFLMGQMYTDSFKILSIPFYSLPFLSILPAIFPGFSSQNSPWDAVVSPGSCFISLHSFSAFGVIF